jgi:hypothetical protein
MLGRFSFDQTPDPQMPGLGAPSYALPIDGDQANTYGMPPSAANPTSRRTGTPSFGPAAGAPPSYAPPVDGDQANTYGMPPSAANPTSRRTGTPTTGAPPAFGAPVDGDQAHAYGMPPQTANPASRRTGTPDFASMVSSVHAATDPVDQAQQHDALARSVYASLKAQGHDVRWSGTQMMVDGRPYTVAGAPTPGNTTTQRRALGPPNDTTGPGSAGPGSFATGAAPHGTGPRNSLPGESPITAANVDSISPNDPRFNGAEYLAALNAAHPEYSGLPAHSSTNTDPYGNVPGFDTNKLKDTTHQNDKYIPSVRTLSQYVGSGGQVTRGHLDGLAAYAKAHGFPNAHVVDDDEVDFGDGHGPIDVIRSDGALQFLEPWLGGGTAPPAGGASPISLNPVLQNAVSRTFTPPTFGGGPSATQTASTNGFTPGQGPTYTPGEVTFDDIPSLSYDDIYNQLTGPGDSTEQASSALLQSILEHPESIDAHTLDTMKGKSKDELAQQQQMDESDLRGFGVANGIDDSRWLQSERLASRRSRDNALVDSNRTLEVQAATTNAADKRAASQLGISYQGQKASQRQAAATLAADTVLRESGLRQDRMALREQIHQKAAELGQSADQIMSQWLLGLMDDATRRYGINVGAQVDMSRLSEQSQEFKEDLAFRILALEQQDRQFGATYGLDVVKTQGALDKQAFDESQGGSK